MKNVFLCVWQSWRDVNFIVQKSTKTSQYLVMNQHLLVIFVYVHQRYNTYWYVETDFFFLCIRQTEERTHVIFLIFFFLIVSPPHIRSAFTTKLQQLYKEGRPRKVRKARCRHEWDRLSALFRSSFKKTHFNRKGQARWYTGSLLKHCVSQFHFNQYHLAQRVPERLCVHKVSA